MANNKQPYGQTPRYITRGAESDQLAIMFCDIRIWKATKENWWLQDDCLRFTEVEAISIQKSYKNIIQKATVKFPRGTVIGQRLHEQNGDRKIIAGNNTDAISETSLTEATNVADTLIPGTGIDASGKPISVINAFRKDDGVIIVSKDGQEEFAPTMISAGDRIEIRLTYFYNEEDYNNYKNIPELASGLHIEFSGFISKCSVSTPITLQCEDMMSILKAFPCPNNVAKRNYTVNDYLLDNGVFHLLKGTGLRIDDYTRKSKINVGKVTSVPLKRDCFCLTC